MLEKATKLNVLYDFYHSLLTDKQRLYMELYYHEDLSLGEIAQQLDVSRQAVFENIKRVERLLHKYERQLQLATKYEQRERLLTKIMAKVDQLEDAADLQQLLVELKNVD